MKDEDTLISELDLNEMKDLANSLDRLTKNNDEKISKKAKTCLLKLLDNMEKSIDGMIYSSRGQYEKFLSEINGNLGNDIEKWKRV